MILVRAVELQKILGVKREVIHVWYHKGYLGSRLVLSFGQAGGRAAFYIINREVIEKLEKARREGKILVTKEGLDNLKAVLQARDAEDKRTLDDEIDKIYNELKEFKENLKLTKQGGVK